MATLDVPNRYLASAPVIVTSPTSRCGTTLVQRLLTASDRGLIYGEEVGHQIRTLTSWFMGQLRFLEDTGAILDADFEKVLAGTLADWRPGLNPPTAVMTKAWIETYYQIPSILTQHAAAVGRPVWGFKCPTFSRDAIKAILLFMPMAKVIYVFRNPLDVLKSAKARRFVNNEQQFTAFCTQWAQNLAEAGDLAQDKRVLFLKYEGLLRDRAEYLRLLEVFSGVGRIDPAAFDLKINTYQGAEADGHSPTQYIQPAELTPTERGIVMDQTGPIIEGLYGELLDAA